MSAPESAVPTIVSQSATVQLDREGRRTAGLGVFFRPHQIDALGFTYDQLRRLVSAGAVEHVARGLYQLSDAEPTEHETITAVCARVPNAFVCLLTALSVYEIGTRLAREVWIAIPIRPSGPGCDSAPEWSGSSLDGAPGAHHLTSANGRRLFSARMLEVLPSRLPSAVIEVASL